MVGRAHTKPETKSFHIAADLVLRQRMRDQDTFTDGREGGGMRGKIWLRQ